MDVSHIIRHSRMMSCLNVSPPSHGAGWLVRQLSRHTQTHDPWKVKTSELHQSNQSLKTSSGETPPKGCCISHRWTVTYGTAVGPLSFLSLALLLGWEIIIQWPYSMSVPLNGCALSMLHCQGASATWPNCNRLQSALGSDPRLRISAFFPISLSPTTTNLLLQDARRLASIRGAQWGLDVPEWKRVLCGEYCSRITVCVQIHGSECCVGGHSTMSIHR